MDRVKNVGSNSVPIVKYDVPEVKSKAESIPKVTASPKVDNIKIEESPSAMKSDINNTTSNSEIASPEPIQKSIISLSVVSNPYSIIPKPKIQEAIKSPKNSQSFTSQIDKLTSEYLKSKRTVDKQVENKLHTEIHHLNLLKSYLEREKLKLTIDPELSLIQEMYQKKTQKFLNAIEEEVKHMDRKLVEAQDENKRLRQLCKSSYSKQETKTVSAKIEKETKYEANPSYKELVNDILSSIKTVDKVKYSKNLEENVKNWYRNIDLRNEELLDLKVAVCKEITSEQKRRLKTEESTSKLLAYEEKTIADLEGKIRIQQEMNGKYMESTDENTSDSFSNKQDPARKVAKNLLQNIYELAIDKYTK